MQIDRFQASQSEEGRYRLLIEAISDYAIYMLDPHGEFATRFALGDIRCSPCGIF